MVKHACSSAVYKVFESSSSNHRFLFAPGFGAEVGLVVRGLERELSQFCHMEPKVFAAMSLPLAVLGLGPQRGSISSMESRTISTSTSLSEEGFNPRIKVCAEFDRSLLIFFLLYCLRTNPA